MQNHFLDSVANQGLQLETYKTPKTSSPPLATQDSQSILVKAEEIICDIDTLFDNHPINFNNDIISILESVQESNVAQDNSYMDLIDPFSNKKHRHIQKIKKEAKYKKLKL